MGVHLGLVRDMLVFFSDIHLTDGSSGTTIDPGAFEFFAERVLDLAEKRSPREVRLVLLGDGLDVIRSNRWLETGDVKPWSPASQQQERTTLKILQAIMDNNGEAIETLRSIPRRISQRTGGQISCDDASLTYVLGNHDWLVNRYASCRKLVAEQLGLQGQDGEASFPLTFRCPEHGVIARHGDKYDQFNYDATAGRDASSIGDAIVVELVNRFPAEVEKEIENSDQGKQVVQRLREIDNVRPLSVIPRWVIKASEDLGKADPRLKQVMRRALGRCVEEFVGGPAYQAFVRQQLGWIQRLYLRRMLARLPNLKLSLLDKAADCWMRLEEIWRLIRKEPLSEYAVHAVAEKNEDGASPRFVVYGHTHTAEVVPLGRSVADKRHRFYLNAGTWRAVWEQCFRRKPLVDFASWKVMGYVVVYRPNEAEGKHLFETWDGRLADKNDLAPADLDRAD